ncbi:MAG: CDP-diacylglycerol--glycerol-3-phosphate 3-phosphatidyltransferase [Verrucomicrobiales bacterium]|nr:CDP-diacylglycerol--glycerol-3-phosphate 3-phosphatidyltransferase [Verrucomicrobiales bacterium]
MNLPNQLTVSRFVLTGAFLAAMFITFPYNKTVALVFFVMASITDWLDGALARKYQLITNFGILMDPLADKILTCSAFIAFVGSGYLPAWMVVVIVARELAITGLRLLAASKNLVLAAERFGKHKTISQIVAIIAILVLVSYEQWGSVGRAVFGFPILGIPWVAGFAAIAKWTAVGLTLFSGVVYLWRNRGLYLQDV